MMHESYISEQKGFTLLEVTIAVTILGVALTVLIGLQAKMLDTYYLERNRFKAALVAQYLMTLTEVSPSPPPVRDEDKQLVDELERIGYFETTDSSDPNSKLEFQGWTMKRSTTNMDLPISSDNPDSEVLRDVILVITWGDSAEEQYELRYLVNAPREGGLQQDGQQQSNG